MINYHIKWRKFEDLQHLGWNLVCSIIFGCYKTYIRGFRKKSFFGHFSGVIVLFWPFLTKNRILTLPSSLSFNCSPLFSSKYVHVFWNQYVVIILRYISQCLKHNNLFIVCGTTSLSLFWIPSFRGVLCWYLFPCTKVDTSGTMVYRCMQIWHFTIYPSEYYVSPLIYSLFADFFHC